MNIPVREIWGRGFHIHSLYNMGWETSSKKGSVYDRLFFKGLLSFLFSSLLCDGAVAARTNVCSMPCRVSGKLAGPEQCCIINQRPLNSVLQEIYQVL